LKTKKAIRGHGVGKSSDAAHKCCFMWRIWAHASQKATFLGRMEIHASQKYSELLNPIIIREPHQIFVVHGELVRNKNIKLCGAWSVGAPQKCNNLVVDVPVCAIEFFSGAWLFGAPKKAFHL
jgi:hypothetical protein